MSNMIESVRSRIQEVDSRLAAVNDAAAERTFTAEEATEVEGLQAEQSELARELRLRETIVAGHAQLAQPNRKTSPDAPAARPAMSIVQAGSKGWGGFKGAGHFLSDVRTMAQGRSSPTMNAYIANAASTNQNEGTAADGAVLVPTDFRRDIVSYLIGQDSLLPFTDKYDSFSNVLTFPYEQVQSFTGTLAPARTPETGTIAEHKLVISNREVRAYKLAEAVNVSEELIEDSLAVEQFVVRKVGDKFVNSINSEIISGSGTGSSQALGFLASPALKVVASQSLQASGTVNAANLMALYFGMPQAERSSGIWIVSPSVEATLPTMVISGTTVPAYQPPGSLSATPYGTILGRPYVVSPWAKALGTKGDISFVDLKKYLTLVKTGGVKTDVSIHCYFLSDITTFKFTMRWGGTPWPDAVITWPDGTTQSPFVTLGPR